MVGYTLPTEIRAVSVNCELTFKVDAGSLIINESATVRRPVL